MKNLRSINNASLSSSRFAYVVMKLRGSPRAPAIPCTGDHTPKRSEWMCLLEDVYPEVQLYA